MPGGNGTGPMGMGPMTGRGMGCCTGFAAPETAVYGCGKGMGRGRGFRRMYNMTGVPGYMRGSAYPYGSASFAGRTSAAEEKELLQSQVEFLEKQLNQVREQLNSIDEKE